MIAIYTIGVYGYTESLFRQALSAANPAVFVDIRQRRGVRGPHYAFANSTRLQTLLADLSIPYLHLPELAPPLAVIRAQDSADRQSGIARRNRDTLSPTLTTAYQQKILSSFRSVDFISSLGHPASLVLFCVEGNPVACHRSMLADRLASDLGVEIIHLQP
jgi:uncharacterized protein (DUF488 family)